MGNENKPGFMVYHDKFSKVDKLPDDQFHWLFRAIARYSQTGETTETDDPALAVVFSIWQDMIDEDGERYQARCEASKKANDARWHKGDTDASERMQTDANRCESIRTDADISEPLRTSPDDPNYQPSTINRQLSTINDQPSKGENATRGKRAASPAQRFSPPTVEEVRAYCKERGNQIDAQHFVDFYASKGWRVGNQPMKDWKACVRTWEQRDKGGGFSGTSTAKPNPALQYSQRQYTDEDDDDFMKRISADLLRDAGKQ